MLELRVLTGTHAGARALLSEGPQVLGSASDCDLILSDEGVQGRHLRIERDPDGGIVLRWEDEAVTPLRIAAGEGADIGPVQIAIDEAGAPWRTDMPLRTPVRTGTGATGPHADEAPHAGIEPGAVAPSALGAPGARRRPKTASNWHRRAALGGAVMLAVLVTIGAWNWRMRLAVPVAQTPVPALDAAPPTQAATLDRVIRQLGMAHRVRVETRPGMISVVRAVGISDEEAEVLAIALSRLSPRPALEITSDQELAAAVAEFVSRMAREKAPGLRVRYLGDGRFAVAGRVADDGLRREIQSDLKQAFAQAREFEWHLVTSPEATTSLVEDLRNAGFDDVAGRWDEGAARLSVSLDESRVRAWEVALARLVGTHNLPLRATMTLRQPPRARPGPPQPALRSVMGGPLPYVVLVDGRKVIPGGDADGWTLVEIQARAVVFEGVGGRRVSMER